MNLLFKRLKRRFWFFMVRFKSDKKVIEGAFKYFGLPNPDWNEE